jgi:hypothetical protein
VPNFENQASKQPKLLVYNILIIVFHSLNTMTSLLHHSVNCCQRKKKTCLPTSLIHILHCCYTEVKLAAVAPRFQPRWFWL